MSRIVQRVPVDNKIEKKILTGLILSDKVCNELLPIIRQRPFKLPYFNTVVKWIDDFYCMYEKAPKEAIEDIYDSNKRRMNPEEVNLIDAFLSRLSDSYDGNLNEEYLIESAVSYIDEISIDNLANNLIEMIKTGRVNEAKGLISNFKGIMKQTSGWIDPFSMMEINDAMLYDKDVLFRYPGKLGDLSGDFLRGHFIAYLAPIKTGKSNILMELAVTALTYNLKVLFISLEIDKKRMNRRLYKRISSAAEGKSEIAYPCFDCKRNQGNECKKAERTNRIKLFNDMGGIPDFSPKMAYRPCSYCRDKSLDDYIPATWWTQLTRPELDLDTVRTNLKAFEMTYGSGNLKTKSYPRFSVTTNEVENDIQMLIDVEGFIPDVIITDYADIFLKPKGEFRHAIDEIWMTHARWATQWKCLTATATQASKESWEKKEVKAKHTSENYRNPAHVDKFFTLSQTPEDKRAGMLRVSMVAARDEEFDAERSVTLLQCLDAGQPHLDSEFL